MGLSLVFRHDFFIHTSGCRDGSRSSIGVWGLCLPRSVRNFRSSVCIGNSVDRCENSCICVFPAWTDHSPLFPDTWTVWINRWLAGWPSVDCCVRENIWCMLFATSHGFNDLFSTWTSPCPFSHYTNTNKLRGGFHYTITIKTLTITIVLFIHEHNCFYLVALYFVLKSLYLLF